MYVHFPSLKTLELSNLVITDDESVKRLLGGCIVLEELGMCRCVVDSISVLQVSVASLKRLYLYDTDGDYEFLLDAPRLESFLCSSYATRGYSGDTLNYLVSAVLDVELEVEHFSDVKVPELVNLVSNARSLTLWNNSMAGLRDADGIFLELTSYVPEPVPACMSSHPKEVEIELFHGAEVEFKMVEYFLKNAKVLEKMTISPSCRILGTKEPYPITKKLLKLPLC